MWPTESGGESRARREALAAEVQLLADDPADGEERRAVADPEALAPGWPA